MLEESKISLESSKIEVIIFRFLKSSNQLFCIVKFTVKIMEPSGLIVVSVEFKNTLIFAAEYIAIPMVAIMKSHIIAMAIVIALTVGLNFSPTGFKQFTLVLQILLQLLPLLVVELSLLQEPS